MRKAAFVTLVALLFATAGPDVSAYTLQRVYNYYTDATFSSACGYLDLACGTTYSGGCSTNWRYEEIYNCDSGDEVSAHCQEWNGTSWVNVACPDERVTMDSRVHITVG